MSWNTANHSEFLHGRSEFGAQVCQEKLLKISQKPAVTPTAYWLHTTDKPSAFKQSPPRKVVSENTYSTARRHRLFWCLGACSYLSIREEGGNGMRSLQSTNRKCFRLCPGLPSHSSSPFLILGSPVVSALPNLASRWGLHYPNDILAKVESLILCFLLELLVAAAQFSKPLSSRSYFLSASGPAEVIILGTPGMSLLHKFSTSNFGTLYGFLKSQFPWKVAYGNFTKIK